MEGSTASIRCDGTTGLITIYLLLRLLVQPLAERKGWLNAAAYAPLEASDRNAAEAD